MKKFILTAIVAVAAMTANAQIWVGGEFGYDHSSFDPDGGPKVTRNHFSILPEVGYSLNDKWDIAIMIGDENVQDKSKALGVTTKESYNTFVVNPYVRYTFYKTGKVGFFLDGGFSIKTGDVVVEDEAVFEDETGFGIGIRPGVKFAASDKVTFVASLGGLGYEKVSDYSRFGFKVNGNTLQFGCYYSF